VLPVTSPAEPAGAHTSRGSAAAPGGAPAMIDIFAGLGTVSHAARHTGFEVRVPVRIAASDSQCSSLVRSSRLFSPADTLIR
jgi:hypothetical protein